MHALRERSCSIAPTVQSLKIADFGLGRATRPNHTLTKEVVTLWYRAPEMMMGTKRCALPHNCLVHEVPTRVRMLFDGRTASACIGLAPMMATHGLATAWLLSASPDFRCCFGLGWSGQLAVTQVR
jgi:serine/threonine protein kinase